ncbi:MULTISPECIES: BT_3044 domain-containing protein [Niastella]|uniref:DUF4361 domain-containing protein n=1 Tax=Niastella soli TaxID=2821487 RepID=A0ABS3Z5R4_9BACT|nr:DUF4361 domain-containing protein [Niastella soli]MBO9205488.1 DUF4361 domain-containing protein [Niastella soli]
MKIINKVSYLAAGISLIITGCTKLENPLEVEQYQKNVYLVGANMSNNEGLQVVELPYGASASELASTFISAGTGGSRLINKDISIEVVEAGTDVITQYNALYLYKPTDIKYQQLNASFYSIPDHNVTVNTGESYGRMPLSIRTFNLHCDSLYALTFKIASVSDPDYISIRKTDSVLLFSCRLYNNYSGTYQETGRYYKNAAGTPDTAALALSRTFKAVNYNTVRFFHLANNETLANLPACGVTVTINSDNTLGVSSWGAGLTITGGGGNYDPTAKKLTIWYNYLSGTTPYQFKGTFIRSGN